MARAVQTGEIVAGALGTDVVVRTGLREFGVGHAAGTTGDPDPFAETFAAWLDGDLTARIPGGESGEEVTARYGAVLEEIADAHRGEAVLVISHGGVMCMALSALAGNLALNHSRDRPLPQRRRRRAGGRHRRVGRALLGGAAAQLSRCATRTTAATTAITRSATPIRVAMPFTHSDVTVSGRPWRSSGATSTTALRLMGPYTWG